MRKLSQTAKPTSLISGNFTYSPYRNINPKVKVVVVVVHDQLNILLTRTIQHRKYRYDVVLDIRCWKSFHDYSHGIHASRTKFACTPTCFNGRFWLRTTNITRVSDLRSSPSNMAHFKKRQLLIRWLVKNWRNYLK